jgi:hypothetical protein
MIKDENQYKVTLEKISELEQSLITLPMENPFSQAAYLQTIGLINELKKEVEEYLAKIK